MYVVASRFRSDFDWISINGRMNCTIRKVTRYLLVRIVRIPTTILNRRNIILINVKYNRTKERHARHRCFYSASHWRGTLQYCHRVKCFLQSVESLVRYIRNPLNNTLCNSWRWVTYRWKISDEEKFAWKIHIGRFDQVEDSFVHFSSVV